VPPIGLHSDSIFLLLKLTKYGRVCLFVSINGYCWATRRVGNSDEGDLWRDGFGYCRFMSTVERFKESLFVMGGKISSVKQSVLFIGYALVFLVFRVSQSIDYKLAESALGLFY